MIWIKRTFLVTLICLVTGALPRPAIGAEKTAPAGKLIPAQLEGKIIALDKKTRLLTVEVRGTLIKITVTPQVKITKNGEAVTVKELAAGQAISLSFMEMPNGRLEVAAVAVRTSSEPVEPAGKGK